MRLTLKSNTFLTSLDFSDKDEKVIAHALKQGNHAATYILVHVVETVSAAYLRESADDNETQKDEQRLLSYEQQLTAMNYRVKTFLGYRNRINEIVRIVHESKADMLVMGAHRHSGLKDLLYGETANQVRHRLEIPVLIVS